LAFTILPIDNTDDIDFVLYKATDNSSIPSCDAKMPIRCMVSGNNLGEETPSYACSGATGLSKLSLDESEPVGCSLTNDNFLREAIVEEGETYMLFINNYSSDKGFLLEFSGDCLFTQTLDCQSELSSIPSLQVGDNEQDFQVSNKYPNPVSEYLNLEITSTHSDHLEIQIIGLNGQIVDRQSANISSGLNYFRVDTQKLTSGVWFLKTIGKTSSIISSFCKR